LPLKRRGKSSQYHPGNEHPGKKKKNKKGRPPRGGEGKWSYPVCYGKGRVNENLRGKWLGKEDEWLVGNQHIVKTRDRNRKKGEGKGETND